MGLEKPLSYVSSVSGFTPTTVKAALDALAGARIKEMGSNSNGTYVKWENGLMVCLLPEATLTYLDTYVLRYRWQFPAVFASVPYAAGSAWSPYEFNQTQFASGALVRNLSGPVLRNRSSNSVNIDIATALGNWTSGDQLKASVYAIGMWK